ncbi:MAG: LamG domain-containing protein [Saprospiraceae bacterium]
MRIALFIALAIFLSSCKDDDGFEKLGCLPANLQTGVIAYYPFSGGSLLDGSIYGNDLTNSTTASATADRNGSTDCAYLFTNTVANQEFLTTSSTTFLDGLPAYSVSIWYQPLDINRLGGSYEVLVNRGTGFSCPDRRGEWSLGLYDCRRAVFAHNTSVWAKRAVDPSDCLEEVVALTDSWQHIVATHNSGVHRIYFNGELQEERTGNAACSNFRASADIGDMFVGESFNGRIDDVLIYNRELTASDVTSLFGLEACCD